MKEILFALLALFCAAPSLAQGAGGESDMFAAYRGLYRIAPDHAVGIAAFITDTGQPTMLFSDYQSGVVRRLYPVSADEYIMGPGFNGGLPAALDVKFVRNGKGEVTGLRLQPPGESASTASRLALHEEEVSFQNGDARLVGTLIIPPGAGPHPAIILLHGSGALTRYSFGPYPYFYASLGFAVLVYDKRGAGASTGIRLDASTNNLTLNSYYPDDLWNDALTALHFLQSHRDIDPKRIGLWGSSEGGMLVTQVAAHSRDVAFIIDSSGFMGPLWQTFLYQQGVQVRAAGGSERDAAQAIEFTKLWMRVGRTGKGWDSFVKARDELRRTNPYWPIPYMNFESLAQLRWYWKHVLVFSPLPQLKNVACPVLAVYGEKDLLTEAKVASQNLQRAFAMAGKNKDVTVYVFPGAGHSLAVEDGNQMTPGVFELLRSWSTKRAQLDDSPVNQ